MVPKAIPAIVALSVGSRESRSHRAPPRRRPRAERLELDGIGRGTLALSGNSEGHSRLPIDIRECEAAHVEAQTPEQGRKALPIATALSSPPENGVARRFVDPSPNGLELAAGGVTE
jgi:hypothetical protein